MNRLELRTQLDGRGLERVSAAILALAAPTIWVHVRPAAEAAIPVGASKMGGQPDLPAGVDWPAWHEPMAFIAQFNLAESAPYDTEGVLPSNGLLSFFYETNGEPLYAELWGQPEPSRPEDYPEGPDPRSWRVLYLPDDPSTFVRRLTPATVNERGRFRACAVNFSLEFTLPDEDAPEMLALGLTEAERLALIDFLSLEPAPNRGTWQDPGNRLLGYPHNLDGSTLVKCDFASRGIRDVLWHQVPWEHWPELQREAARRWRLLFQVDSGEAAQMDWAGGGLLHYCIEHEALARRDFSRAWLNLQFL